MNQVEDDVLADLARVYTMLRRRFDKAMNEQGASMAQTKVLLAIKGDNGSASAADLAYRFGVAPRTMTEALDVLERDGLIARTPDATDRRVKRLTMTPAGARAAGAAEPLRQALSQEVLSALDEEERRMLHLLLRKMLQALSG